MYSQLCTAVSCQHGLNSCCSSQSTLKCFLATQSRLICFAIQPWSLQSISIPFFFFVQFVAWTEPAIYYRISSCFILFVLFTWVCVCLCASHLFCLYHTLESQSTCSKEVFPPQNSVCRSQSSCHAHFRSGVWSKSNLYPSTFIVCISCSM